MNVHLRVPAAPPFVALYFELFEQTEFMTTPVAPSIEIGEFVDGLRKFPAAAFVEIGPVLNFLKVTPVVAGSLAPFLNWNSQHYTRNLIDKTALYELIAICWEVGQSSSVHNHLDQNCWMAVPMGRLLVQNYRVISEDLQSGKCQLATAETVEMSPTQPCAVDPAQPVHRVYNPRDFAQRAVSLHVYSRPFNTCVVYSQEQGTCGMINLHYTTEYGKKV